MKTLNKPNDNMGGLLKFWAVPPADITIGRNTVSFSKTTDIVQIYCTQGSTSFSEKEVKTRAGTMYETELAAFAPKDSPEAREIITEMTRRKYIIIYIDQNEYYKVVGTAKVPLHVKFDLTTGADTPDRNGHSVLFYGKQLSKAKFISNPF